MLGLVVFSALLAPALTLAAPGQAASDPCAAIAGQTFADPALVISCQKSFPFSEKLRQNVMTVVSRYALWLVVISYGVDHNLSVFNFYTFEEFYLNSPPPFQESTSNINATLKKLSTEKFAVRYSAPINPTHIVDMFKRRTTTLISPSTTSRRR